MHKKSDLSRRDFMTITATGGLLLTGLSSTGIGANKNPICVFSKHLQWLDYPEMAKTTAEIGFDGVDLTVRPGGHVLPEKVTEDLPRAVEACQKAGVEAVMMTTAVGDVSDPLTEPILKTASKLGIQYYRTAWLKYDRDTSVEDNLKKFIKQLGELAAMNEHYKIRGAYQNHAGDSLGSAVWDIWMVLKEIDSDWLGCQYDIRHATVEGANSWPVDLKLISPYINTIDVKDFHWSRIKGKWQPQNVPLGEGMVDFAKYFDLLKQLNVQVPMCVHYEYDLGGAERGRNKLSVAPDVVVNAMKKDLRTLKKMLSDS